MNRASVMVGLSGAASVAPVLMANHAHKAHGHSSGELSCDPRRFRSLYPDKWTAFLRAHFNGITQVAAFFDVDAKTARNWWEGTTGPQGWAVEYAHSQGLQVVK